MTDTERIDIMELQMIQNVAKRGGGKLKKRIQLIRERKKRNLTRKQVADALQISEIHVRKIEEGTRNPGRQTMVKFEILYDKSAEELFPELFQVSIDTKRIELLKGKQAI